MFYAPVGYEVLWDELLESWDYVSVELVICRGTSPADAIRNHCLISTSNGTCSTLSPSPTCNDGHPIPFSYAWDIAGWTDWGIVIFEFS